MHIRELVLCVVGILVAIPITQILHQFGRRIAYDQRDRFIQHLQGVLSGHAVGHIDRIGFRRHRHVDDRFRQGIRTFRHADIVAGIVGTHRQLQGSWIGNADIFRGKADDPSCHVQRIFSGFQHPGQPVNGRIGIGIAHRFMQGRDDVVVFFTLFVI